ncbi:A24 family peptidase [Phyllobacterium zundukense]|uniref:Peptidase n=1 Tax=Phyllobacterium zundukense TaxID=1867719 RepID=A0A2N9VSI3_9HYPH|nr:prepilin peptidase [Phyllobacterium zundukense]ATU92869.1 peptidase [Phyllobacterium zundukense]PIO42451.1 peptidase [Phyllobacterium zundukense]
MIEAAILIVFPFAMAFAGVSDLLSMTIQNRVSLILVVSFAVLAPLTGMPWDLYGMHFVAGAAVLAATFALFATGTMGGGDAKLMSATAVWLGWNLGLAEYLLTMSILGGLLTIAILRYRSSHFAVAYTERFEFMRRLARKDVGVPYGIALGLAGLLTFPASPLCLWVINRLAHI